MIPAGDRSSHALSVTIATLILVPELANLTIAQVQIHTSSSCARKQTKYQPQAHPAKTSILNFRHMGRPRAEPTSIAAMDDLVGMGDTETFILISLDQAVDRNLLLFFTAMIN